MDKNTHFAKLSTNMRDNTLRKNVSGCIFCSVQKKIMEKGADYENLYDVADDG